MSFGSNLWDRQESINNYLMTGKEQMVSLGDLMKTLANAEEAYANVVGKMVKSYKDAIAKANERSLKTETPLFPSNVRDCWETLIRGLETKANMHKDIGETITKQRKILKENAKALDAKNEQNWDKIRASMSDITKMIAAMESKNQAYYKDLHHIETASANLKKYTKERREKDADKAKAELDKYLNEVIRSNALYQEDITKVNEAKRVHFEILVTKVLDDIQADDESIRTAGIKDCLIQLSDVYLKSIPLTNESWTIIQKNSASIDPMLETSFIVSALTTGNKIPIDFDFTDTANEFQQKKGLRPANEMEEDLSQIGDYNKKGKKILAEKIKAVEADIIEIEKRRQLFDTIVASSSTRDMSRFEEQKEILHEKMQGLLMKKHRLHVFVAQNEGKPIPNAPGVRAPQNSASFGKLGDSGSSDSQSGQSFEKIPPALQKVQDQDVSFERRAAGSPILGKKPVSPAFAELPFKLANQEPSSFESRSAGPPIVAKKPIAAGFTDVPFKMSNPDLAHSTPFNAGGPPIVAKKPVSTFTDVPFKMLSAENSLETPSPNFGGAPILAKKPVNAFSNAQFKMPVKELEQYEPPQQAAPIAATPNMERLRALYDFDAANDLEVSVKVGDLLYLVMERDDGWSQCQTENGEEGLVPTAYIGREAT